MAQGHKTGGRKAGTPNKATAELKTIARQYTDAAVKELARLALEAASEQARVSAIKELLDRGYGRATQPLAGDHDHSPIQCVVRRVLSPDEAIPDPALNAG